jgi:F0F1-type ATP synthase membrane subunit c/vacuolar-type H+-ATPase subunit K
MSDSPSNKPPEKLQFWIIWFAVMGGVPVLIFAIKGGWPSGEEPEGVSLFLLAFCLLGVIASVIIRWAVLSRISTAESLMKFMIIGLALAESTALFGMFLIDDQYPQTQQITYIASLLGMLQFAPTYTDAILKGSGRQ